MHSEHTKKDKRQERVDMRIALTGNDSRMYKRLMEHNLMTPSELLRHLTRKHYREVFKDEI